MLNLKPAEFWDLSWPEFWLLYEGWQIRRQYDLEGPRLIMAAVYNSRMGVKRQTKPQNIFSLPEIDRRTQKTYSKESWEALRVQMSRNLGLPEGQLIQFGKPTKE